MIYVLCHHQSFQPGFVCGVSSMQPSAGNWFRRQLAELEKKQSKEDEWAANTSPARLHLEMDLGDGLEVSNPNFH